MHIAVVENKRLSQTQTALSEQLDADVAADILRRGDEVERFSLGYHLAVGYPLHAVVVFALNGYSLLFFVCGYARKGRIFALGYKIIAELEAGIPAY